MALRFALGAGELFDVNQRSEYVETIIGEKKNSTNWLVEISQAGQTLLLMRNSIRSR